MGLFDNNFFTREDGTQFRLTTDEQLALHSDDPDRRLEAVRRIDNQEILAYLAQGGCSEKLTIAAVQKLTDTEVLCRLLATQKNEHVRLEVLQKISDQDILLDAALNNSSGAVRSKALKMLDEAHTFVLAVRPGTPAERRMEAIGNITDPDRLTAIINYDELPVNVRLRAVSKLESLHPEALAEIGDTVAALKAEKEKAEKERVAKRAREVAERAAAAKAAEERAKAAKADGEKAVSDAFRNKAPSGTIRHIVCLCYDAPYINSLKPEMQNFIVNAELNRGSIITPTSRITFDSFGTYDNASLDNPQKLKELLYQTYALVYNEDCRRLADMTVAREVQMKDGHTLVRYFLLYE